MAELDGNNVVRRVIVAPDTGWPAAYLGGTWMQTDDPYAPTNAPRYASIGYRWDATLGQFFPWTIDNATGSLWCLAAAWDAVLAESQETFLTAAALTITREQVDGIAWAVFGGRAITEDDVLALVEVLA